MPHPSNRSAIDLFLNRLCSHSRLSDEERQEIRRLPTSLIDVRAHIDFVRLGETTAHACLVADGLIGRFGQTEDGKRQFVSIHVPGEMVDLPSIMIPQSTTALSALSGTTILRVPHNALRAIGFRYPAIAAAFWRDCVLDAGIVSQWLINVGRRDARSRLAHLLCELAIRYRLMDQSDGLTYELPMTQDQLADALGLTPVHTNRMLMALRSEGLVSVNRNRVEIPDLRALEVVAEFDPTYLRPHIDVDA